jgi:hypothetical protein
MRPDVVIFEPEARDEGGFYFLPAGMTHVFPFRVPFLSSIKVEIAHLLPNSQDWSIDVWFSTKPLDGLLFARDASLSHFNPTRRLTGVEIYDELLRASREDDRAFQPSSADLYINVKNLQNKQNTYRLVFTTPE